MTAPFFKNYFISFAVVVVTVAVVIVVIVVVLKDLGPYLDCKSFSTNDHFFS